LRIRINNEADIQYATIWVTACIHLHAFAIDHEDGRYITKDKFYRDGRKLLRKERRAQREWAEEREREAVRIEEDAEQQGEIELLEGKLKRENLKKELFAHLDI